MATRLSRELANTLLWWLDVQRAVDSSTWSFQGQFLAKKFVDYVDVPEAGNAALWAQVYSDNVGIAANNKWGKRELITRLVKHHFDSSA